MPGIKPFTDQVDSEQTKAMHWIAFLKSQSKKEKRLKVFQTFDLSTGDSIEEVVNEGKECN